MLNPAPDVTNFGCLTTNCINSNQIRAGKDTGFPAANSGDLIIQANNQGNNNEVVFAQLHYDVSNPTFAFSTNTQIKNISDPTDPSDVAIKSYVDTAIGDVGIVTDTNINDVTDVIDLTHKLTSGTATNGIGTGINFKSVITDATIQSLGSVDFATIDATNPSQLTTKFVVNNVNAGSEQQVLAIDNSGDIEIGDGATSCSITCTGGQSIQFDSTIVTNEGLSANQVGSSATYNVSPLTVRGQTTSGAPSTGSSTSIPCYMEVRSGVNKFLSKMKTICTDNVLDEEKGDFIIELLNNTGVSGSAEEKFRTISDGNIQIQGPNLYKKQVGASITTAGPATYTAENILSGLIIRDCSGSSRTDTLITGLGPTGLVQNIPNAVVGTTFNLTIANISGTGEDITLQEVVNFAVIEGITSIKSGESINAQIVVTDISGGAEKYTMYTLGGSGGDVDDNIHTVTDTAVSDVSTAVTLKHLISAGTILAGIGTGMDFVTQTTAGEEIGMSLTGVTTNVGAGTEAFDFVLNLMAGGATADEALRVTSNKVLTIPTGGDIFLPDNAELRFGDNGTPDVNIKFDATDLLTTMVEGSNIIKLENSNTGFIVKDPSDNIVSQTLGSGTTLFRKTTNSDNAVENIVRVQSLLNTPGDADVGYGVGLAFDTNDLLGNLVGNSLLKSVATDTTDGAENYDFYIQTCSSGSLFDALQLDSDGTLFTNSCKLLTDGSDVKVVSRNGGIRLSCAAGENTSFSPALIMTDTTAGNTTLSAGTDTGTKITLFSGDRTEIVKRDNTGVYNTVTDVANIKKLFLQNGLPAVGCGVGLNFSCELLNAGGTAGTSDGRDIGNIAFQTEDDAQDNSYNSKILFYNHLSETQKRVLQIDKNGAFEVGNNVTPCTIKSQTSDLILASASDKKCRLKDTDGNLQIDGPQISKTQTTQSLTELNAAIDLTYDNTTMLGGMIFRNCNGETRTDTIATGKQTGGNGAGLVFNFPNAAIGVTFELTICNISTGNEELIINTADTSGIVKGANVIRAGENMQFTGVIRSTTTNSELYDLLSHGTIINNIPITIVPTIAAPNYLTTINSNSNETWTPAQLMSGFVRRISTTNREDILPTASDFLAEYPNFQVGSTAQLLVIKTTTGRMDFNNSAGNTFKARTGNAVADAANFDVLSTRVARAGNNQTTTFNIVVYEIGATPKIELIKTARN